MRIKKGDTVMVITGKDKGKHGKVLKAMPKENRVIVEGVNIVTKHAKATRQSGAEIKHFEGPMHPMSCTMTQRQKQLRRSDTNSKTAKK